jgi:phage terminase small subunit
MEHWDYNIKQFESVPGMLTSADRDLFAQYCLAWQEYYDASQVIAWQGLVSQENERRVMA